MRKSVIYLVSILLYFSCSSVEEDAVSVEEKQYPDQESWNTEIILTKDGQKKATVLAGHLTKNND